MEKINALLTERAELVKRLAELDGEILEQYKIMSRSPKIAPLDTDSKFIVKARKDCAKLLYCLRGRPRILLNMLLESSHGVLDYDETIEPIWGAVCQFRRTQHYMSELFNNRNLPYRISAHKHGVIRLLPK